MITVLAGGVGAARLLTGLVQVVAADDLTAIVNVGDDTELHGLHISPDLDTITYTLAGVINPETGWGLTGETWQAMTALRRYQPAWFNLGDRDLGTHLFRTTRLREGATLCEVTAEIAHAWELPLQLLAVSNDPVRTRLRVLDPEAPPEGTEVGFQEYFVQRHHDVAVSSVRFEGAEAAHPAPGVLEAIDDADIIVIAPSNPIVSISPLIAVPGVRDAITRRRSHVVAVSPIVAGAALKGPAARLLTELGFEASVVGVAELYAPFASTLVIDQADAELADDVERSGMRCIVAPTIMSSPEASRALAEVILGAVDGPD
jgi:LPPG:FO 2-phospho-L-lactate transferase